MRLTAQQKKNLYYLVPLIVLLIGTLLFYFLAIRVRPNDKILTNSEGVALFANENPTFEVEFGSKENPDGQWIRFEAKISNDNPFSSEEKKNIFTKIASIFAPKNKSGIEMSLRGVDFSETSTDGKALRDEQIQKVADILGTEEIKTSTVLTEMGREIGENEGDQIISKQTIVNQGVADGVDLEYQVLKGLGLKEEIVINDLEAYRNSCDEGCKLPLNEFVFDLKVDDGVVLKKGWFTVEGKSSEVYYFVDGNGKYLAHFLPSYAVDDSGNKTYEVDLTINEVKIGNYEAKVTVSSDWLLNENRVYPIRIDPSIVHDDITDFSGGVFNRVESVSGPKIQAKKGVDSKKCIGGTVTYSGQYVIHTFTSNDTLNCTDEVVADILAVGGGGGGGGSNGAGGGGGGGGVVYSTGINISKQNYAVTVGAGGNGSTPTGGSGGSGSNSTFGSLVSAIGGGGGGGYNGTNTTAPSTGGSGGGGGASEVGTPSTVSSGGDGGDGISNSITGTAVIYGGGGGGGKRSTEVAGLGGAGGGGAGGLSGNGVVGTNGLGGGGGGGANGNSAGGGGSGIVIVRYLNSTYYAEYISSSLDLGSPASGMTMSWLASGVNTGNGETPYSTTGMVAQWNFNETSGTAAVSGGTCGTSCNGTLTNMTTTGQDAAALTGWTANNRRWGTGAVMFDGSNDFVTVTNNSLLNPTTAVTVEGWVNMNTLPASGGLYEIAGKSSTTAGHALYDLAVYNNSGTIQVYWRMHLSSGLVTYVYQTNYAFVPGTWYYVVGTYDKAQSKMSVYINGVKVGSDMSTLGEDMYSGNNQNLFIGVFDYNGTKSRYFNGVIDSTRIYSRSLSATEILSNYQSGNIEFQYRTSTDNSTWSNWTSYNDGALMFDGNDDYVSVGDVAVVDALTSFSTCAWVNNDTLTTDSMIWSKVDNSTWSGIMFVKDIVGQVSGRTNVYKIWVGQNSSAAFIEGATNSAAIGVWQHVCATFIANSATGLRLYVNGVEDANSPVSTVGITGFDSGTNALSIGRYNPGAGSYIDGSIDNIQIYNRVLSGSEIASNYTVSDFETPYSSSGLLAHWKFNELSGTTATSGGACGVACNGTLTNFSSTMARDSSTTSGWTAKTKLGSDYPEYSFDNPYLYNPSDTGLVGYWPMEEVSGSGAYIKNTAIPFATGGTVTYSGGYTIHTFTSSGTLAVNGSGKVEVLVVGGGGGGGYFGGGGAGGYLYQSSYQITGGNKTVIVGGGGTGAALGNSGSNSIFDTLTAYGGGGGGITTTAGLPGGSGGGGVIGGSGAGTSGQGYAGGTGVWVGPSGPYGGGGGGGASQVGFTTANNNGGNGGAGIANSISGSSIYYAGGGGGGGSGALGGLGGSGGSGGGGNGARSEVSHGTAGTNGLGGGGGGGGYFSGTTVGYNGGSGVVIVRYPTSYTVSTADIPASINATGGTITYAGGYTIHTFTSSGTFVANNVGNVEVLVAGGGGGGGGRHAGGGGGGGVRTSNSLSVTSGNYSVTVGNGGTGGPYGGKGGNGGDSVFSTITSTGGGGGGGYTGTAGTVDGASGGSGGGAAGATGLPGGNGVIGYGNTPSTSPAQGYNGGASSAANYAGGGGGGAGAVGNAASGVVGGSGGIGVLSYISGVATYYGGGGGGAGDGNVDGNGGAGGLGGGGRGTGAYYPTQGTAGTANTGGGGGGSRDQAGAAGGSGVVIIRYRSYNIGDTTPTGTAYVNGKSGGARSFNGSSDYLSCTDASCGNNLDVMGGSISISAWVKPNTCSTVSVSPGIIDKFDTATSKGYLIYNEYYSGANVWTFYDPVNSSYARSTTPCIVGAWTHLTAVYDSSTSTKKMYINGKLEANLTSQSPMGDSGSDFNIGRYRNAGYYYNGIIDEVRVFNTALSASTISSDYISGIANKGSVISQNGSNLKLEGIGSTKLVSGAYDVDSNTVGLWHLDERSGTGAYINDSTVGVNHGTPTGTTYTNVGKIGGARSFNGTTDYIRTAVANYQSASSSGTMEAWIKLNNLTSSQTIFQSSDEATDNYWIQFRVNVTTGTLSIMQKNNDTYDQVSGTTALSTNRWYHVAVVSSGTAYSLYVDGVAQSLTVGSGSNTGDWFSDTPNRDNIMIGMNKRSTSSDYMNGYIDEVRISNVARTASEIAESYKLGKDSYINQTLNTINLSNKNTLGINIAGDRPGTYLSTTWGESAFANYQPDINTVGLWHMDEISGSGAYIKDVSSYGRDGTPTGTTSVAGKFGQGRNYLFSSNHSISLPKITNTSTFTLEAWVYPVSGGSHYTILGTGQVSPAKGFLWTTDQFSWNDGVSGWTTCDYFFSAAPVGQWSYLTAVRNSGTDWKFYRNGIQLATTTTGNNCSSVASIDLSHTSVMYLGRSYNSDTSWNFNGTIDEVRASDIARTADQIRQAYEIGLRTHNITVTFGAGLGSGNLITGSGDYSFNIDATKYGLPSLGSELYPGDKVIIKENYNGTESIAQGTVSSVNLSTGAVTVSSWDSGSTFPSSGYTVNADVFKWQKEYIPVKNRTISTQVDATNLLSFRINDGNEGRNIWIDDLRSSTGYLKNSSNEVVSFASNAQYVQYKTIFNSWDSNVTPYLSQVQIDYDAGGPTIDQLMRHGQWLDSSGAKQGFWWVGTH